MVHKNFINYFLSILVSQKDKTVWIVRRYVLMEGVDFVCLTLTNRRYNFKVGTINETRSSVPHVD